MAGRPLSLAWMAARRNSGFRSGSRSDGRRLISIDGTSPANTNQLSRQRHGPAAVVREPKAIVLADSVCRLGSCWQQQGYFDYVKRTNVPISSRAAWLKSFSGSIPARALIRSRSSRTDRFGEK